VGFEILEFRDRVIGHAALTLHMLRVKIARRIQEVG
jgi:hypothetical protein